MEYFSGHKNELKNSSTASSTSTIRITTSSATPTSPVSTIIHKHDSTTLSKDNVVQSSVQQTVMTSQIQTSNNGSNASNAPSTNSSKDHHHHHSSSSSSSNSNVTHSKTNPTNNSSTSSNYPNATGSSNVVNSVEFSNDAVTDATNKANYTAMTKKRKALHQANTSSSSRNSADENLNK